MPDHDCISTRGCFVVIRNFFYFVARRYSLIFFGAEFLCPAVVSNVEMGAGMFYQEKNPGFVDQILGP